jgi:hypothetical protein
VVGEQGGAVRGLVAGQVFDRLRHRGVRLSPPLSQLRRVGHLLRERVLERERDLRIQGLLVQELGPYEPMQSIPEVIALELRHGGEQRLSKLPADHRRRVEQLLLALRQPIDASREQRLHGPGNRELRDRPFEPEASARAAERSRLDQPLDHLLDEEGISCGPIAQVLRQAFQRGFASEPVPEELGDRCSLERPQRELLVVGAMHPVRVVLGSEVDNQQRAALLRRLGQHLDEGLGRRVDPVQVLEDDHGRLALAARSGEAAQEVEEPALASLGRHVGRRPFGIWNRQELEEDGQRVEQLAIGLGDGPGDLLAGLRVRVARLDPEGLAIELEDGKQGERSPVWHAVRLAHQDAPGAAALGELEAQPALAQARLSDDANDSSRSFDGLLERGLEDRHFVVASHELREAPRARDVEARAHGADAFELENADKLRHTLDS